MYLAITIKQPWVEFHLAGIKGRGTITVENRVWLSKYRGLLLITSAKVPDKKWEEAVPHKARAIGKAHLNRIIIGTQGNIEAVMPNGKLVGAVIQTECTKDILTDWCIPGQYHQIYVSPIRFTKPVAIKGNQKPFSLGVPEAVKKLGAEDKLRLDQLQRKSEKMGLGKGI